VLGHLLDSRIIVFRPQFGNISLGCKDGSEKL
jgi:hypothetical protein